MRILIVDDEEELVSSIVERLELREIDATGATRGEEALQRLAEETYDVVLVDLKMPGMDGLEVVAEIKRRTPGQKVVMLTGHGSAAHAERGMELGAFAYLMKPIKLDALLEVLQRATAGGGGEPR